MSAWNTGPELLISTKRMDSCFGKNAANRVEESYVDATRRRAWVRLQPELRRVSTSKHRRIADWIVDLLGKLGREDDAYDAVALIVLDLAATTVTPSDEIVDEQRPRGGGYSDCPRRRHTSSCDA